MVKDEDKDGLVDQERQTESRRCCLLALSILFAMMTVIAIAYGVIYVVCGQFKPSPTPGPPPPCQDQCVYVLITMFRTHKITSIQNQAVYFLGATEGII